MEGVLLSKPVKYLSLCLLVGLFASCNKYSADYCEGMAMKISQGNTSLSHQWNNKCTVYKDIFTPKKCQKAFRDLLSHGSEVFLKDKYGSNVLGCFKKRDRDLFLLR
jgi:hypothetical protein